MTTNLRDDLPPRVRDPRRDLAFHFPTPQGRCDVDLERHTVTLNGQPVYYAEVKTTNRSFTVPINSPIFNDVTDPAKRVIRVVLA